MSIVDLAQTISFAEYLAANPSNLPPVAAPFTASIREHETVDVDLLQHVSDPDGDPLSIISAVVTSGTGSVDETSAGLFRLAYTGPDVDPKLRRPFDDMALPETSFTIEYVVSDGAQTTTQQASVEVWATFEDGELLVGSNRHNILVGTSQDQRIYGLGGLDRLRGWGGDDILFGGEGHNWLRGGRGADSFVFERGHTVVVDFDPLEGDILDLTFLLSDKKPRFAFEDFGDVRNAWEDTAGGVLITSDDGFTLRIKGMRTGDLTADDFLFISDV